MTYKLEKLSDQRFQAKLSPSSPLWKFRAETPHAFEIPNCVTPAPMPSEFQSKKKPLSLGIPRCHP